MNLLRRALPLVLVALPAAMAQDSPFAHDAAADLVIEHQGEATREGARIIDLTFAADPADPTVRTRAYLVLPAAEVPSGSAPGILWGHWLGEPETTNRTQFLPEAVTWARRGAVSVLTEARVVVEDWRWKYNHIRPHGSLGYISPIEFEQELLAEELNTGWAPVGLRPPPAHPLTYSTPSTITSTQPD